MKGAHPLSAVAMTVAGRSTCRPQPIAGNLFIKNGLRSLINIAAFNTKLHKKRGYYEDVIRFIKSAYYSLYCRLCC